jgi:predicted nucleotidyltransferase
MLIHHSFDEIFRSWSHVAVIRALLDSRSGDTGNEIARISGMQPRSALKALTKLETMNIVRRQRGGRDHLFTLNREHVLVRDAIIPLFERERDFLSHIAADLTSNLRKSAKNVTIFGSVARREETPLSDFDLCCIVESEKEKTVVRERLQEMAHGLHSKYGITVSPLLLTMEELQRKQKHRLVKDLLDHGILLFGKKLRVLIRG